MTIKRTLRRAALALTLCALPVAAQDNADEDDGGGFLENLIEDQLSGPGFQVSVRGFEGALSSRATIESLVISDDNGPWLTVNNAALDWNRAALLRGRLSVNELSAEEILVPRLPQGEETVDVPNPEAQPFSLPDLPVSIQIGEISAARVELGETVIGVPAELSLDGSASLAGGEGEVDIRAERLDGERGVFEVSGGYENESRNLSVNLLVDEGADGIVASLIDLPGRPSLELRVEGDGPLSDFTADIALQTAGEPRLDGTVELIEEEGDQRFVANLSGDIAPVFTPQYRPFFGPNIQLVAEGQRGSDGAVALDQFRLQARSLDLQGQVRIGADGVPDFFDVTGEIASDDGAVTLPVGEGTQVDRVGLDLQFDASESEDWNALIEIAGLDQPGIEIANVTLDGGGVIAGAGESLSVTADLDFSAAGLSFDDPGLGEAVGDRLNGRVEVDYEAGDPILLETLRLAGAGFQLQGSGQVDPDGENIPVALDARLDADDLAVFAALAGRPLSGGLSADVALQATLQDQAFDLSLDGSAQDLALGIDQVDPLLRGGTVLELQAIRDSEGTRVPVLRIDNEAIDLTGDARITSEQGEARINLTVDNLGRIDPELAGPATVSFEAVNPGEAWQIDLTASGARADVTADVTVSDLEAESPLAEGTAEIIARDLSQFTPFVGRDLGGSVDLALDGRARLDTSLVEAEISGQTRDVTIDQPEADRLLRGVTEIALRLSKLQSQIDLPELLVSNPQITLEGSAGIAPQNSTVDVRIDMPNLSEVVPSMSGPASVVLDAVEDATGWTIDLDATGAGARVIADGRVTDLNADDTSPLAAGDLSLAVDDLSVFSELARRELGGTVDLSAEGEARFDLSQASGTVEGTTRNLALGQAELNRLFAGLTRMAAEASKDGDAIRVPNLTLSNPQISVDANGQYGPGDSAVQANVNFPNLGDIVPEMSGPGSVDLFAEEVGEIWQVSLDGTGAGVDLSAMAEIADLTETPRVDGRVELTAADLSRFRRLANRDLRGAVDLTAEGSGTVDGSRFDVTADVTANRLALGIPQVDQLLAGRTTLAAVASRDGADAPIRVRTFNLDSPGLDASAQGTLLGGNSNLTFNARLANLGAFVPQISGPVTAQGRAGQAGSSFTLDIGVTGPQGIAAQVDGRVAESFDSANLRVNGSSPLRLANPFLGSNSITGQANFDVALNGPLQLSSVTGQVTVGGGRFVVPSVPLTLADLNATARLNGNSVQLNATASNPEGGQLRVSGPIGLSGGFNADLLVELLGFALEDPRLYTTSLDGRINVNGPLTGGARIAGGIQIGETELRIPSTGLGATGPIPDGLVHRNEPADVRATRARAGLIEESGSGGGGGVAYPLDLTISAPNRIFVRGRGLDAELGGRLTVRGTTADIIPAGQFDLIRGRLDLLGQRLNLTEGQVTLAGNFTPRIRLVAETDAGDVTVRIVVEGEALSPEISFLSDPELPEDEVLSRLLFGRSIDNISPLQAAQLASAVATLAGRGGDGIIGNLRQSTGLDDLDITTDEDGNVGVRAGAYLSENLYTDVTVDATGEAEINLNLDVTNSITVRGGASNSGETSLGIFFERDY
ncbi:autotransporter secretion inner membrane protein TamB [Palleronia salina]|uniref:Autotransporter secretion inner membrane protein TamB n=1 Tax=Palleronia salina TaxID=313368 RepID=A0A1M6CMA8_9RHOB|nr:translocation/assembly module TamB domain-containing protein [Palleronia salina]SHI62147.1 autotransporter secretion inner membrane protein TamB [Palleronia salina]